MPNAQHLSNLLIKPAQDDHFLNALTRCWLSLSRAVAMVISSANCSQCFGGINHRNENNNNNKSNEIAFIEVNHFTEPKCIIMCCQPLIRMRTCTN